MTYLQKLLKELKEKFNEITDKNEFQIEIDGGIETILRDDNSIAIESKMIGSDRIYIQKVKFNEDIPTDFISYHYFIDENKIDDDSGLLDGRLILGYMSFSLSDIKDYLKK